MILITGDTHGSLDIEKIQKIAWSSEIKYLIILGDFGVLWGDPSELLQYYDSLPVITLWLDGNHENFDMLKQYPVETWCGGSVHRISDKVLHLMRGEIFVIEGLTFFVMGGGHSIDKKFRIPGISWWPEENPSHEEYEHGLNVLREHEYKVDYILTHSAPTSIVRRMFRYPGNYQIERYLQQIYEITSFKHWYFGHYHEDRQYGPFTCVYNEIIPVVKDNFVDTAKMV